MAAFVLQASTDGVNRGGEKQGGICRRSLLKFGAALGFGRVAAPAWAARPEGVNRPELLPAEMTPVIDLERFLTSGERTRLIKDINQLESATGFKLRVLTQRFPQTPGLAIRDYWGVDDNTVVLVADYFGGTGNLLKFNVGDRIYDKCPPRYWSLLASRAGNQFFVRDNGEDTAILAATGTIIDCLGSGGCVEPVLFTK